MDEEDVVNYLATLLDAGASLHQRALERRARRSDQEVKAELEAKFQVVIVRPLARWSSHWWCWRGDEPGRVSERGFSLAHNTAKMPYEMLQELSCRSKTGPWKRATAVRTATPIVEWQRDKPVKSGSKTLELK